MAEVARMLGTPLMPWQQYVADVALEIDPDSGLLVYREVVLTVPRQSGKTTLALSLMVHRALGFGTRQRILYTAQTRNDARKKWEDEHVATLLRSPLRTMFKVRKSNGAEAIRWKNGSMHGITSTTEKAGHGETLDLGFIDEAFALEDDRLEQSLKPTMITRPQPQLWVNSTAGHIRSLYLRGKVDAGRDRARAGLTSGVAYFEWSAAPDSDPGDPATWRSCMPALGHTVTEAAVAGDYESMKRSEFQRAYLNWWPDDAPDGWLVIDEESWLAVQDEQSQIVGPMAFAADVTPDRRAGAIATAGRRKDGLWHIEVIDHRPGTGWMVDRITELRDRWKPCAVVVDVAGPAGSLLAPLEATGVEVVKPSAREAAQACGQLYDAVMPPKDRPAGWKPTLRHLGQPELSSALAGAQKRPLGDAWAWARKGLSVDISPLVTVTLALWGHAKFSHVPAKKTGSRPKAAYL